MRTELVQLFSGTFWNRFDRRVTRNRPKPNPSSREYETSLPRFGQDDRREHVKVETTYYIHFYYYFAFASARDH